MRCHPCELDWDGPRVRFCGRCGAVLRPAAPSADRGNGPARGHEPAGATPRTWRAPARAVVLAVTAALVLVAAAAAWLPRSETFEVPDAAALATPAAPARTPALLSRVPGRCAADAGILPPGRRAAAREAGALATVDGEPCILAVVRAPADRCPVVAPAGCRLR